MARYLTGIDGAAGGPGTTWAGRFDLPSNMLSASGYAAGDELVVGHGPYRESLVPLVSGITVTSTGTITMTNESTAVVGAGGANWTVVGAPLPVVAGDQIIVDIFASGVDGQTYGTTSFTSAANPFQANMVGYMIEIVTVGTYIIASYVGPGSITLRDVNNLGNPGAAGPGLTFRVISGEGPYRVASVGGAAALTLDKPWSGPTLSALSYEIYRPVYFIGDISGEMTDGIGGVIRLTGTDDDEALAGGRSIALDLSNKSYWHIRGFQIDSWSAHGIYGDTSSRICIEDCTIHGCQDASIQFDYSDKIVVRRCTMSGTMAALGIYLYACGSSCLALIENCHID